MSQKFMKYSFVALTLLSFNKGWVSGDTCLDGASAEFKQMTAQCANAVFGKNGFNNLEITTPFKASIGCPYTVPPTSQPAPIYKLTKTKNNPDNVHKIQCWYSAPHGDPKRKATWSFAYKVPKS